MDVVSRPCACTSLTAPHLTPLHSPPGFHPYTVSNLHPFARSRGPLSPRGAATLSSCHPSSVSLTRSWAGNFCCSPPPPDWVVAIRPHSLRLFLPLATWLSLPCAFSFPFPVSVPIIHNCVSLLLLTPPPITHRSFRLFPHRLLPLLSLLHQHLRRQIRFVCCSSC